MENHLELVLKLLGQFYKEIVYKVVGADEEKGLEVIDYFETTGIDEKYVAFVLFLQ